MGVMIEDSEDEKDDSDVVVEGPSCERTEKEPSPGEVRQQRLAQIKAQRKRRGQPVLCPNIRRARIDDSSESAQSQSQ